MTKPLFTALLIALAITGCSKSPVGGGEVERVVKSNRPAASTLAAAASPAPRRTPIPVAKPVTALPSAQVKDEGAEEPTKLDAVVAVPTDQFRAYPVFTGKGEVLDVRVSPANGSATWQVTSTGKAAIGKLLVTYASPTDDAPVEVPATAADLKWPAELAGEQSLKFPVACSALVTYLRSHPTVHDLVIGIEVQDPSGQTLLTLSLPVTVL